MNAKMLEEAIEDELTPLINRSIFDHGFPESRLVPSNFYEECLSLFLEELKEKICDEIDNIVHDLT